MPGATVIARADWARDPVLAAGNWEGGPAGISLIMHESTAAGHGPRLHRHPYPETFLIEEGSATFRVGDDEIVAGAGQIIVVPADVPHSFSTLSPMRSVHIHASPQFITEWLE